MQAKELANELMKYPNFEVVVSTTKERTTLNNDLWGIEVESWDITGVSDIGYSDRVILLEGKLR